LITHKPLAIWRTKTKRSSITDNDDPGRGWHKVDMDNPASCHQYCLAMGVQMGNEYKNDTHLIEEETPRYSHSQHTIRMWDDDVDSEFSEIDEDGWMNLDDL
jgi:hypothetical protein